MAELFGSKLAAIMADRKVSIAKLNSMVLFDIEILMEMGDSQYSAQQQVIEYYIEMYS